MAETLFIVLLLKLEYNCNDPNLIKVSYNNNNAIQIIKEPQYGYILVNGGGVIMLGTKTPACRIEREKESVPETESKDPWKDREQHKRFWAAFCASISILHCDILDMRPASSQNT